MALDSMSAPVSGDAITAPLLDDAALLDSVNRAADALTRRQKPDGHFVFELEADATIPAEYVLLEHFLARIDPDLEARFSRQCRGFAAGLHCVPAIAAAHTASRMSAPTTDFFFMHVPLSIVRPPVL